jgi:hypothetical protein
VVRQLKCILSLLPASCTCCLPHIPPCSKFLARNISLERLLKEFREDHHPSASGSDDEDKEGDSCNLDSEGEEDPATQTCADSATGVTLDPEEAAAAAEGAAAPGVSPAAEMPAVSEPAAAPAAAGKASPAARASPTSSSHSEQCGVNSSADALQSSLVYQVSLWGEDFATGRGDPSARANLFSGAKWLRSHRGVSVSRLKCV